MKRTPKIAVIEFPGTNCEQESATAIKRNGAIPYFFRWNDRASMLEQCDGIVIPGGFSYEDRSRSGIIAAMDPLMDTLKREAEKGKPILGICNGAQILIESGLVPGFKEYPLGAALAPNVQKIDDHIIGTGFYNAWVYVTNGNESMTDAPFTASFSGQTVMRIPAAHAEGRFTIPPQLLTLYRENKMIPFRYCDQQGNVATGFPENPNGSVDSIAALTNIDQHVMAIMPHPERTVAGDPIFLSMIRYIEKGITVKIPSIDRPAIQQNVEQTVLPAGLRKELTVASIVTDNTAVSVERELRRRNIPIHVKRMVHWTLVANEQSNETAFETAYERACSSGILFNPNKEYPIEPIIEPGGHAFVVKANLTEDSKGERALRVLHEIFKIDAFSMVEHAILWILQPDCIHTANSEVLIEQAVSTHIFNNPFSQRRIEYV